MRAPLRQGCGTRIKGKTTHRSSVTELAAGAAGQQAAIADRGRRRAYGGGGGTGKNSVRRIEFPLRKSHRPPPPLKP